MKTGSSPSTIWSWLPAAIGSRSRICGVPPSLSPFSPVQSKSRLIRRTSSFRRAKASVFRATPPTPTATSLTKPQNTNQERAQRANAGPHRISGADGDVPLGKPQKKTAQNHAENGAGDAGGEFAGPCAGRLRKFETQRPSDLAETGQHQINPGHILKRGITFRSPAFPNGKSSKGNGCLAEYPQASWNQEGNSSTPCHTEQHGHPGRNPASVLYKFHRGTCYRQSDKRKTATS